MAMPAFADKVKTFLSGDNDVQSVHSNINENDPNIFVKDENFKNMATCKPETFHDIDKILVAFKESVPVILLLRKVKSTQHRQRIIDFCFGLVKGLDGAMEPVDTDVFILTPFDYAPVVDVLDTNAQAE
jgi:cell division inhibitor SepF